MQPDDHERPRPRSRAQGRPSHPRLPGLLLVVGVVLLLFLLAAISTFGGF